VQAQAKACGYKKYLLECNSASGSRQKETLPVRQIGLFYSDKNGRATSLINITVKNSQKILQICIK
jgi:hypothetical protein